MPAPILMTSPDHFSVQDAINPHMRDEKGALQVVDRRKARQQWQDLKNSFLSHGLKVLTMDARPYPDLRDIVFAANHGISLGNKKILMGKMRYPSRSAEIHHYRNFYLQHGFEVLDWTESEAFEGQGDALWCRSGERLFCGYGFRSHLSAAQKLSHWVKKVIPLQLVDPHFYHLDTCFVPLKADTLAYLPQAFHPTARAVIKKSFSRLIELDAHECLRHFAGNGFCPDEKNVWIEASARRSQDLLTHEGFVPRPVNTQEFIKSGGSVFCLKMEIFPV